ncbi:hypothetical protein [Actinoplanes sp. NPDC048796]|uniref:hypothetical protein n=1 Tax=unclassified Actinoplanes TaxID=2626549 RepID=UPI0033F6308B
MAAVVGGYVVGVAFLVGALLVFSGAVTVAGLGEETVVQRVGAGMLAVLLGGVTLCAATLRLGGGNAGAGTGASPVEDAYLYPGAHPGVGEF